MMKKTVLILFILLVAGAGTASAQTRYIVKLKDKAGTPYSLSNPGQFLSARAISRRTRYNIAVDSADLPVIQRYVDSIRLAGAVTILNTSRWLNQVCFQTSDAAAIVKINNFPFVTGGVSPVGNRSVQQTAVNKELDPSGITSPNTPLTPQGANEIYNYGQSFGQVNLHNGQFLHRRGFTGAGMQMAVTDAGFFHYLTLPTFDSARNNGQILGTRDFVAGGLSVDEDHPHGMQCLSTILANMPGVFMGTAPKTSVYLFRTEDAATENPVEEQNWAAGAELADSLGVDLISVSLGYTTFDNSIYNHTYAQMNGNTTIISRAADMAAQKGMLVVIAAGNEGNGSWHYISAPADADSVLTIGAVNTSRVVASFSSYGPSSDGQVKPDVAAVGQGAIVASTASGQPVSGNGTSFACPNMAGIATCLWQAFPEVNNMSIIDALRKSSDKANVPDDRTGYGIPDAKKATVLLIKKLYTQNTALATCKATISFSAKSDTGIKIFIERKLASEAVYTTINTIQGTGSFTVKPYSYVDDLAAVPLQSVNYRIRMSISADTTFFLDSATVAHNSSCGGVTPPVVEKITINPNPVSDKLTVSVIRQAAVNILLVLQNTAGQQIYTLRAQQAAGGGLYKVPMKDLPRGVYYISVYVNDKKEVTKKIVR
jgi:serine protease AprX